MRGNTIRNNSTIISTIDKYATMRTVTQDTPKRTTFGYKTFYETSNYHIVRNKRGRFYEKELNPNTRELGYTKPHVTTVSIEKFSERPPIYRTDGSPNANRFENINKLPEPSTKTLHTSQVNF